MRSRARTLAAVLLAACAWACVPGAPLAPAPAAAQIAYGKCGDSNDFACGHLTVPLDPAGATGGTVTLAIRRHRAPVGEARSAIVALAGGPGQPALPFAEAFARLLGPIAATRDLIVFDQRGIGLSDPLSCHAFERPDLYRSFGALIAACGGQLGPARAFYTTADTVADIEAIRRAGGYQKLVLYGTSYGTKVAEQYAQRYPDRVEALVLDSVVPPDGPEPLARSTFAAVGRVLHQLCARRACAHVSAHPVADLARLVARTGRAGLHARAIAPDGRAQPVALSSEGLLELLLAGDFSQPLRAAFVTAVAAGARGDLAPLARLELTAARAGGEREDFDSPLYYATLCEEEDFPWSRATGPARRLAQVRAAARAMGASAFAPFTAADAVALSDAPACAHWPFATSAPPPAAQAPLPDVPALILSGAEDLRTPTANARELAAAIPDSHLLVVPDTGHSVLTDEQGSCARHALRALFAGRTVEPCPAAAEPRALPPPLPPSRLARVAPAHGYGGRAGRTLHALALTLVDAIRQLALQVTLGGSLEGAPALHAGGLRGGWAVLAGGVLALHAYSYVPGVTVSGSLGALTAHLQVGGPAAARGGLHGGAHETLVGTLGGRRVTLPASVLASAAIVGGHAQRGPHSRSGDAAERRALRVLARLGARVGP